MNKPDGFTFIGPSKIEKFMESLPVDKFFGVGKVTATKMKSLGLHTGADLKKLTEGELTRYFGKAGKFFYKIVRGNDPREVQPHRETKSIGAEDTFQYDLTTVHEMNDELDKIGDVLHERLKRNGLKGRTITLKIKYHDFKLATRSHSYEDPVNDFETIISTVKQLLLATGPEDKKIRLLGISISNFGGNHVREIKEEETDQLKLF